MLITHLKSQGAQDTQITDLEAFYVAEMVRAEMVARFGSAATTAGLKVTTTIDSRLQTAANRAIRDTLMAYDERHGYRGPLATIELLAAVERWGRKASGLRARRRSSRLG